MNPNLVFKFKIPRFFDKFGTDWDDFVEVIGEHFDHFIGKAWALYDLRDFGRAVQRAIDRWIDTMDIPIRSVDDDDARRGRVADYVARFKDKALPKIYIDTAEEISGQTGEFRDASANGWTWGDVWVGDPPANDNTETIWSDIPAGLEKFVVNFDAKTTDPGELDAIQAEFLREFLVPTHHRINIVDASDNILRKV